jgi:hypothetical protein
MSAKVINYIPILACCSPLGLSFSNHDGHVMIDNVDVEDDKHDEDYDPNDDSNTPEPEDIVMVKDVIEDILNDVDGPITGVAQQNHNAGEIIINKPNDEQEEEEENEYNNKSDEMIDDNEPNGTINKTIDKHEPNETIDDNQPITNKEVELETIQKADKDKEEDLNKKMDAR